MRVVCVLLSPGVNIYPLAECALRLSPQVALGEHWFFLEIGKCRGLYSEDTVIKRLRVMLQRFGVFGHVTCADDLPTSLALARYNTKQKNNLPVRALSDFLNPFGYSPALIKMFAQFEKLGIYTLEDFMNIPRKTLVSRFGKEGLLAAQRLAEAAQILWPHFKVQEKIEEKLIISTAPESIETLLFYIKTLADRVASRLIGRHERVSKFELKIHQEKFSHVKEPLRKFVFELPLAQSAGVSLLSIIRERLSVNLSREPLQSEVELIEIKVLDTIPLKTSQRDFLNRDEEEREAWASLIGRLEERLGKGKAFIASVVDSYLPEKGWQRTLSEEKKQLESVLPYPQRPLRIFKKPLTLLRQGHKLSLIDSFQFDGGEWEIQKVEGPERVREEWWQFGSERDYFKVQTRSGETLWIFQNTDSKNLFLHGVFD